MKAKLKQFFSKYKYGLIISLVVLIIAFLDLLTKHLTDGKAQSIISGVISIFSTHNTGAAWSILSQHIWLLIVISIIFILVMLVANYLFKGKTILYTIAMGLILGGAICNLFDRIIYGYVRDFISLDFMNFPIFNVADIAITVGVILLCCFFLFQNNKTSKKQTQNVGNNVDKQNQTASNANEETSISQNKSSNNQQKEQ